MTARPANQQLRHQILAMLAASPDAMRTADVRRCLSETFGQDLVHEHVYRNLVILEHRGDVARTAQSGRHTLWRLSATHQDAHHRGMRSTWTAS